MKRGEGVLSLGVKPSCVWEYCLWNLLLYDFSLDHDMDELLYFHWISEVVLIT